MTCDDLQNAPEYECTVIGTEAVTPRMRRVLFDAPRPSTRHAPPFASTGRGDEFVRLTLHAASAERYYTIRSWDAATGRIAIDFVQHGHGAAAVWAGRARAGDRVGLDAPRGHWAPPGDAALLCVAGDATALPAIGRILDDRADRPPAHLLITVDQDEDRQQLRLRDGDRIEWLRRGDDLVDRMRAALAQTPTAYTWFSGEAAAMRRVRALLRSELGLPPDRWMTMGYWRHDSERWRARFDGVAGLAAESEQIWTSDLPEVVQSDLMDALLERHGL